MSYKDSDIRYANVNMSCNMKLLNSYSSMYAEFESILLVTKKCFT